MIQLKMQVQSAGADVTPDTDLNLKIRSLNKSHREIFDLVQNWLKQCEKHLSSISSIFNLLNAY